MIPYKPQNNTEDQDTNNDIYQEHIIDHYKHPRHKYHQKNPTYSNTKLNPLCGDELTIEITTQKNSNIIKDISFEGNGCAISLASASILTEYANSKEIKVLVEMTEKQMIDLLHIPISHTRTKCALLALKTSKEALTKIKHQKLKNK